MDLAREVEELKQENRSLRDDVDRLHDQLNEEQEAQRLSTTEIALLRGGLETIAQRVSNLEAQNEEVRVGQVSKLSWISEYGN